MINSLKIILSFFLVILTGCGGGNSETDDLPGGIDPTKTIAQLNDNEVKSLCDASQQAAAIEVPDSSYCSILAATTPLPFLGNDETLATDSDGIRAQCAEAETFCQTQRQSAPNICFQISSTTDCVLASTSYRASCSATVSQWWDCMSTQLEDFSTYASNVRCSDAPQLTQSPLQIPESATTEASCGALEQNCPGFVIRSGSDQCLGPISIATTPE